MHTTFVGTIDLAQVILVLFIGFFIGLVYYLQREGEREGYPLENDPSDKPYANSASSAANIKTYLLADGSSVQIPSAQSRDSLVRHWFPMVIQ
jgi:photosynthetic reaction center H subunit